MPSKGSLWGRGAMAVVGALFATLLTRSLGLALFDVPPEFIPLDGPGPTIFFTVVLGTGAVGVYGFVRRRSAAPRRRFRQVAAGALLLSFLPDFVLLSEGAASAIPGATPSGVSILMAMHVVAAAVIVGVLTTGGAEGAEGPR